MKTLRDTKQKKSKKIENAFLLVLFLFACVATAYILKSQSSNNQIIEQQYQSKSEYSAVSMHQ
ncbi:MAG: hypothetical protein AAFO07_01965 [Bacteroidota bacterium]